MWISGFPRVVTQFWLAKEWWFYYMVRLYAIPTNINLHSWGMGSCRVRALFHVNYFYFGRQHTKQPHNLQCFTPRKQWVTEYTLLFQLTIVPVSLLCLARCTVNRTGLGDFCLIFIHYQHIHRQHFSFSKSLYWRYVLSYVWQAFFLV